MYLFCNKKEWDISKWKDDIDKIISRLNRIIDFWNNREKYSLYVNTLKDHLKILKRVKDILRDMLLPRNMEAAFDLKDQIDMNLKKIKKAVFGNILLRENILGSMELIEELSSLIDELSCT